MSTNLPYEAAAEWFLKIRSADPTTAELQEWNEWLKVEANSRAFDVVTRAWQSSEGLDPVQPRQKREGERWLPWALAAGILMAAMLGYVYSQTNAQYTTAKAEQRSIRLVDGTRVTLGAESAIEPVIKDGVRSVTLSRGEAFFEVVPDAKRPFVVTVNGTPIRVLGTSFNVRALPRQAVVSVAEGKVLVRDTVLTAGQQASISGSTVSATSKSTAEIATWREGRLLYRDERLGRVLEDVNRYSLRPIVLADAVVADLQYSGTVQQDRIEDWLRGLPDIFPVHLQAEGEKTVIRLSEK